MTNLESQKRRNLVLVLAKQGLDDNSISIQLGLKPDVVGQYRRKFGLLHKRGFPRGKPQLKLRRLAWRESVDWTKQDITIAREMKVSRERARQMRLRLGKPKHPNNQKRTQK